MNKLNYDICIIGGGINGVGIARDAAGRGLRVLLCEKNDLASGTSSASSKLIHGGLRYLEYGELSLVREALQEREVLLNSAPHIIWPLTFYLPWQSHLRPRWLIRLGLFLYDHLAKRRQLPGSGSINFLQRSNSELKDNFVHGFHYADCWVDDSRLVVLNAKDAQSHGADIFLHTTCQHAEQKDGQWLIKLTKANGEALHVTSKALVNASGPWVDHVSRDCLQQKTQHNLQTIKGSHIIVPKLYSGTHAYLLQNSDKRIVFVLPFLNDFHLIGTTDINFQAPPEQAKISGEEINYLCQSINSYFKKSITANDIVWTYSGVRGLVDDGSQKAQAISRDYVLEISRQQAPLMTVFGGKITTYRCLAEQAVNSLAPLLGCKKPAWTAKSKLPGGDIHGTLQDFINLCQQRYPNFPSLLLNRLARTYGSRIEMIIGSAKKPEELGQHFGGGLYEAEVKYLINEEWATTAEDILFRRSKLALFLDDKEKQVLQNYLQNFNK